MNNFVQVNEVYSAYFTSNFPARATIEARRLPKDANVEISLEAVQNEEDRQEKSNLRLSKLLRGGNK